MSVLQPHVTLKDVARRAGCSPSVVSTIVNHAKGNTLVSEQTRARVLTAAKELGYRPDFASRSLVRRRTRTLGIYIPPGPWAGLGYTYEGTILRGIEAATLARGYDLLLLNVTGNQGVDICARKLAERRIDGLILMHVDLGVPWLADLIKINGNIVIVDYPQNEPGVDTVGFDNHATGRAAVEHLLGLGHKRIGYVGSCREPANIDAAARQQGYLDALADHKIPVQPEWVFNRQSIAQPIAKNDAVCQLEGQYAAQRILQLGPSGPTAWIAYSDLVAVHLMRHLNLAGVRVPEQLSIVGVDDSEWARFVTPALTSVRHSLEEMGQHAANVLIDRSETQEASGIEGRRVVFPPQMIVRESTAPPPSGG